ncbi:immunity protein [Lactobacillus sp. ESL0785]|uniref:immunity protein n=1 Tax=Lactobacillus sp. ESL0785 TaxID=2983232 RepID=UPI0023F82F5F|nr:immunity protein [Lactobacillus sp. ESL0785]WEV71259.1 immunity protein [Lactobacillus sp. ESL0785]
MSNTLIGLIMGVVCILAGLWEFYAFRKHLQFIRTNGNKETSTFLLNSYWFSIVFSVLFFIAGVICLLKILL